jgi:putative membrane protein
VLKFFRQVALLARLEARPFLRAPKLLFASAVVALIPSVYAVIYLSSVWDPAANAGALPVALVNLDEGVRYRDNQFNVGVEVATRLRKVHAFGFKDFTNEQEAREQVRQGRIAFALIIPRDFSSNAIPGDHAGAGKLVVYMSEGNNFESALIARHFAQELGHDVNENLNERRWQLVLLNVVGSQRAVDRLHEGVSQLRVGARELSAGATQALGGARQASSGSARLNDGVTQMTTGIRQLASGLRTLDDKRIANSELTRLKSGTEALVSGHAELAKGIDELQAGTQKLRSGVASFREESQSSILVPGRVVEGLDQVGAGLQRLDEGLQSTDDAQQKLADGAGKLNTAVGSLTSGIRSFNAGLHTIVSKLPEDTQFDELDSGGASLRSANATLVDASLRVKSGAERLASGLELLASAIPAGVEKPGESAQGLATSVQPEVEIDAAVKNSGSAFAPNIIPAALWLGAGIAAFLIHVRLLPRPAQSFSRPAQLLGKMAIPGVVVLIQAVVLMATVRWVLNIQTVHPGAFALVLAVSSLSFLFIVFALTRTLGDAGKVLAMIFLIVQLSSSGGVLPVELSGPLFADISPWMPLTWVVRALKASLFDAYAGAWQAPLQQIAAVGTVAAVLACWLGRWRYVRPGAMRAALDF